MKKFVIIVFLLGVAGFLFVAPAGATDNRQYPEVSICLWQLANQARAHPLETIRSLGLDEAAARQALGDDAILLDTGLPPLAWDNLLSMAAMGHNLEMVNQLYYSSTAPDGALPADRVAAAGYDASEVGELLGAMAFSTYMAPEEAAKLVFTGWLRDELDPSRTAPRHIFSRDESEVGFSFIGAVLSIGDGPSNVYVVVADFARPLVPRAFLIGTVYVDVDGDGRWSLGEGLPGVSFNWRVAGWPEIFTYVSGIGGVYQLPLVSAIYTLSLPDGHGGSVVYRLDSVAPLVENRLADLRLR